MRLVEIGITNLVLRAGPVRESQFRWPPLARSMAGCLGDEQAHQTRAHGAVAALLLLLTAPLSLRLEARRKRHEGLLGQELRQLGTEAIDLRLEAMIEHVADHGHATQHPLASAPQLPVVKLRHRAVAVHQGLQQRHNRVGTDSVALSQFVNFLLALVCQSLQRSCSWGVGEMWLAATIQRGEENNPASSGWLGARAFRIGNIIPRPTDSGIEPIPA